MLEDQIFGKVEDQGAEKRVTYVHTYMVRHYASSQP